MKPGESVAGRRLRPDVHAASSAGDRARTTAKTRPTSTSARRRHGLPAEAREAPLRRSAAADDRGWRSCHRPGDLYVVLGDAQTDGADRRARLFQSAGHAASGSAPLIMAIGGGALAVRPAAPVGAPRRAPRARRRAGGVSRARALLRCVMVCWRSLRPRCAVQPDEMLADPALEKRGRGPFRRAALPRLPEPVDRRFATRRSPRDLRALVRERLMAGDSDAAGHRLSRRALRRVRAAEAALRAGERWLLWLTPVAGSCWRR